jgi:GntR family transcriptional regulator
MSESVDEFMSRLVDFTIDDDGPSRYQQIAEAVESAIASDRLVPGDRLPPERDLAEAIGVSRDTVRQALVELQRHGRVTRTVGRYGGTYIAEPKVDHLMTTGDHRFGGLSDQLRGQNIAGATKVLLSRQRTATPAVAAALQIEPGAMVYELHRIRYADGEAVALERTSYPGERLPGLLDQKIDGSIYEILRTVYGRSPERAIEYLEPILAGPDEVSALGVASGAPLMYVERVAYDETATPVEFSRDVFRGDRTRMVVVGAGVEAKVLRGH